jgi:hypothetical protein
MVVGRIWIAGSVEESQHRLQVIRLATIGRSPRRSLS